jgi:hypothetical protein
MFMMAKIAAKRFPHGTVVAPVHYTFSLNDHLRVKRGRELLKLVRIALDSFLVLHKK